MVNCQPSTTNNDIIASSNDDEIIASSNDDEIIASSNDDEIIANLVDILINAIVESNRIQLENLSADELLYAHSGGKVQNKNEFIAEIMDPEALDFISADITNQSIIMKDETAIVRHIFSSETMHNGTPGNLQIGVMLVWHKVDGDWKLLGRQAYKLPQ